MKTRTKILGLSAGILLIALTFLPPATLGNAAEEDATLQFLNMMDQYLGLSRQWVDMASDDASAVYLALEGIIEIYEGRGEKAKAIPHLERLLDGVDDPAKRNLIRFKIRDLYNETGRNEQALGVLDAIVAENR